MSFRILALGLVAFNLIQCPLWSAEAVEISIGAGDISEVIPTPGTITCEANYLIFKCEVGEPTETGKVTSEGKFQTDSGCFKNLDSQVQKRANEKKCEQKSIFDQVLTK